MRDADYERLVVPNGNADEAIHRWFHMKEAYSPYLFPRLLKDLSLGDAQSLRLHDPFLGSGTTLVSALLAADGPQIAASGTEVNPFLGLVARAKLGALTMPASKRAELRSSLLRARTMILKATEVKTKDVPDPPVLAAFGDERYFPADVLSQLLRMRDEWIGMQPGATKDLVGLALGACVEPCSRLRRDGRALRYEELKTPASPVEEFRRRVSAMADDLASVTPRGHASVHLGDGLEGAYWPAQGTSDLVCFSPPYPNNIDYTEVYKLEAWFLGLIVDRAGFRAQRGQTMRSHPSLKFGDRHWPDVPPRLLRQTSNLVEPLVAAVPTDRYSRGREMVIRGFAEDCAVVLHRTYASLKRGGQRCMQSATHAMASPRANTQSLQMSSWRRSPCTRAST